MAINSHQSKTRLCVECGKRKPLGPKYFRESTYAGEKRFTRLCRGCHQKKYQRPTYLKKSKHKVAPPGTKTQVCTSCGLRKSLEFFSVRADKRKSGAVVARYRRDCRRCVAKRTYQYHALNGRPDRYAEKLRAFGMTLAEYDAIASAQGWTCALCRKAEKNPRKRLAVDHCHQTGEIRGLLCTSCNHMLGRMGDTVDGVRRVLAYLSGPSQASQILVELRKSIAPSFQRPTGLSLLAKS